mmetsp:Transcript_42529/g.131728  ORF Transcript_42529/g.131728 Transcript_42529/m.131728 type:complete len:201 (-) Transcript_42529:80-682(-)
MASHGEARKAAAPSLAWGHGARPPARRRPPWPRPPSPQRRALRERRAEWAIAGACAGPWRRLWPQGQLWPAPPPMARLPPLCCPARSPGRRSSGGIAELEPGSRQLPRRHSPAQPRPTAQPSTPAAAGSWPHACPPSLDSGIGCTGSRTGRKWRGRASPPGPQRARASGGARGASTTPAQPHPEAHRARRNRPLQQAGAL